MTNSQSQLTTQSELHDKIVKEQRTVLRFVGSVAMSTVRQLVTQQFFGNAVMTRLAQKIVATSIYTRTSATLLNQRSCAPNLGLAPTKCDTNHCLTNSMHRHIRATGSVLWPSKYDKMGTFRPTLCPGPGPGRESSRLGTGYPFRTPPRLDARNSVPRFRGNASK